MVSRITYFCIDSLKKTRKRLNDAFVSYAVQHRLLSFDWRTTQLFARTVFSVTRHCLLCCRRDERNHRRTWFCSRDLWLFPVILTSVTEPDKFLYGQFVYPATHVGACGFYILLNPALTCLSGSNIALVLCFTIPLPPIKASVSVILIHQF